MLPEIRQQVVELTAQLKSLQGRLSQAEAKQVDGLPLARLCIFLDSTQERLDKQIFALDKALKTAEGEE